MLMLLRRYKNYSTLVKHGINLIRPQQHEILEFHWLLNYRDLFP